MFHLGVLYPSREIEIYGYRPREHTLHLGLTISDTAAMLSFSSIKKRIASLLSAQIQGSRLSDV